MAIKGNITIDQGADFSTNILLRDESGNLLDLNGYSGAAQMRRTHTSLTAIDFTVAILVPTSEIVLSLTNQQTANITPGRYVYDVELTTNSNTITRIVEGIVTVTPEVTR